ncbi:MAG: VacB/RNase II family 3'-5' exoribonuclease, partial [Candidatus Riflebacteria bacterium]|nr:VacB/RNase II family 3'-5' exoribonuclease [Candidatus Riflebacteria bacterium]
MKNLDPSDDDLGRQLQELIFRPGYRPLTLRALLHQLRLHRGERTRVRDLLRRLMEEGRVARSASRRYGPVNPPPERPDHDAPFPDHEAALLSGSARSARGAARFTWTGRREELPRGPDGSSHVVGRIVFASEGYGFLLPEPPLSGEIFVPARERRGACQRDLVEAVIVTGRDGRPFARVLRVLERHATSVLGRFDREKHGGRVVPRDRQVREVRVLQGDEGGARSGDLVRVELLTYPTTSRAELIGRVESVLGPVTDPAIDLGLIASEYDLPLAFPDEVERQALRVARVDPADLEGRVDLRSERIFTIDGDDARDFDDAVSLAMGPRGRFHLGVHIADVDHYVPEGGTLDLEAGRRGTSVYLPEAAIPMLPAALSGGTCSLVPGEDRLTLTVSLVFSRSGERVSYEIFPSIIRSERRLTYSVVEKLLSGDARELRVEHQEAYPTLVRMAGLARLLRSGRRGRGCLDFDLAEPRIELDQAGNVAAIGPLGDPVARNLIEEFMIAANEAVADLATRHQLPMVYRIHEVPDRARLLGLGELARALSIDWRPGTPIAPADVAALLEMADSAPSGSFLKVHVLRSLKQARYAPVNAGHFGLASRGYTHFTSPIRRYPDLVVQRLVKHFLGKPALPGDTYAHLVLDLAARAERSSDLERRAQAAERAAVEL